MNSLSKLLVGQPTLVQLEILERADRFFPSGRFYFGPICPEHLEALKPKNWVDHEKEKVSL